MKLIVQNTRVVATATDDYSGLGVAVDAPEDFDLSRISEYVVTNGVAAIPAPTRVELVHSVKVERDRRKFNGVFVSNKWIHTDTYSRTQWMGMVMMGAAIPAISWTTMDNTTITTSQSLANAVFQATANLDATLFAYAKTLIETVEESNDPASIDITTGWPATFEGAV